VLGRLLGATQKGVIDFPALAHAPIEKRLVWRLCRTTITPNQMTLGTEAARPKLRQLRRERGLALR
jgi:hypothetical protein